MKSYDYDKQFSFNIDTSESSNSSSSASSSKSSSSCLSSSCSESESSLIHQQYLTTKGLDTNLGPDDDDEEEEDMNDNIELSVDDGLKTIYDRNKSYDLFDSGHIFKFAVVAPNHQYNDDDNKHLNNKHLPRKNRQHSRTQTLPYYTKTWIDNKNRKMLKRNKSHLLDHRQLLQLNESLDIHAADSYSQDKIDSISYSVSPSPEPIDVSHIPLNRYRSQTIQNHKSLNSMNNISNSHSNKYMQHPQQHLFSPSNATSTTNTFDNAAVSSYYHRGNNNIQNIQNMQNMQNFIPQPRASHIEKTFTWSDYNGNMKIPKPFISNDGGLSN